MSNWVKLSRKLLTSAIAAKPEYLAVWIHLLLSASYKEGEILVGRQVVRLLPGQLVFGRHKFSEKTGVSESIVRSALKVLENLQQITIKSESKFSIITVTKWSFYQEESPANNQQLTSKRPAVDHNKEIQELQEEDQKLLAPAHADAEPLKKARQKKSAEGLIGIDQMVLEGCDSDHARDWLLVRKKKRSDLTPTAWAGMKREAAKAGIEIGQAVRIAAERGWQAFKSDWDWRSSNVTGTNTKGNRGSSLSLSQKVRLANGISIDEPPAYESPPGADWEGEFERVRPDGSLVGFDD